MKEKHNYTVKTYFDTTDEERILRDSEDFFANKYDIYDGENHFFEERRKIEDGKKVYICGFCKHRLKICGGQGDKKQTLHFRHYKGENKGCIYEEEKGLLKEEVLCIKYNGAKESKKHEDYKNFIAERLLSIIDPKLSEDKVLVEKIYRDKSVPRKWRKPDVLAMFPDKTIAFELQLSTTFLSIIAAREAFYQKQQIFILWIFDSFSAESEEQLFAQKDILVSNVYNVFVLDKEAMERSIQENAIYLKCYYVDFYIRNGKIVDDKMISQLVSLSDLTFRKEDYKVFYIDAIEKRNQLENELKNIQKAESFMEKIEDIYSFWSAATLIPCLEALDIAPVYPKIKAKLDDIIEKGSATSIRNGILLTRLIIQSSDNDEYLQSELKRYHSKFEEIELNKRINEILSLLEEGSSSAYSEIETLNDEKAQDLLKIKIQGLVDKILNHAYCPRKKNISIARSILGIGNLYLSNNNRERLNEMIIQEDERVEHETMVRYEAIIDKYIANETLKMFIDYYHRLDFPAQQEITKALLNKYRKLFFLPTERNANTVYYYLYLLKDPSVWFDIRLVFDNNDYCLINFTNLEHEKDSRQNFFREVIYCLFKAGYDLSIAEEETIIIRLKELYKMIKEGNPQIVKNEVLKYSILLYYLRIQKKVQDFDSKLLHYNLLHNHWTFISRIASVLMNFIIDCDLPNMASIADNIKSYHLDYAHLFILAAESENGRKNVYKGKKGNDNLLKLKEATRSNPKYEKKDELDKLMPILFPNVDAFKVFG